MPPRRLSLGLTLLALVACVPPRVTVVPEALQGLAPLAVQVDPHLFALTERWVSGGAAGDVPVGELLRQVLVDDPQAPLRLTYVTSQLHAAGESRTLVSAARASTDAITQAVGELYRHVATWRAAVGPREGTRCSAPDDPAGQGCTHERSRAEGITGGSAPGDTPPASAVYPGKPSG